MSKILQKIEENEKEFEIKYCAFELCHEVRKTDGDRLKSFLRASQLSLLDEVKKAGEYLSIKEVEQALNKKNDHN